MKKRIVALLLSLTICAAPVLEVGAADFGAVSAPDAAAEAGDVFSDVPVQDGNVTDEVPVVPEVPAETPEPEAPAEPEVTQPPAEPQITETPQEPGVTETPDAQPTPGTDADTPSQGEGDFTDGGQEPTGTPELTPTPEATPTPEVTPTPTIEMQMTTVTELVAVPAENGVYSVKQADWEWDKDAKKYKLKKPVEEKQKQVMVPVEVQEPTAAETEAAADAQAVTAEAVPETLEQTEGFDSQPAAVTGEGAAPSVTPTPTQTPAPEREYFKDELVQVTTDNDTAHTGWYLFDKEGYMVTGKGQKEDKEYYLETAEEAKLYKADSKEEKAPWNSNLGQARKDAWRWDGTAFSYYNAEAVKTPVSELKPVNGAYFAIDGSYYSLDKNGKPVVGEATINKGLYYFRTEKNARGIPGEMYTGWLKGSSKDKYTDKNRWRYFETDSNKTTFGQWQTGARATQLDTKVMGSSKYLLDKDGYLVKNKMQKASDGYTYGTDKYGKIYTYKAVKYGKDTYFFEKDGRRAENKMVKYGKYYYFMQKDGKRTDNKMITYQGATYYFDKNGRRAANKVVTYNGAVYFFQKDGRRLENSPLTWKGSVYFLKKDGKRAENCVVYWKGAVYFMQKNGKRLENSMLKWKGATYFMQKNGKRADNKLIKYGKYRYYFGSNGKLVNWKNSWHRCPGAGNRAYYFGSVPGRVVEKKGWQRVTNYKTGGFYGWFYYGTYGNHYVGTLKNGYYLKDDGRLASGLTKIGGRTYFFQKSSSTVRRGKMYQNKLFTDNGKIYYAQSNGTLFNRGWKQIGGSWYYFQSNFTAATSRYAKRGSINGYLDSTGKFTTGWVVVNDSKNLVRYLDPDHYGSYLKNCSKWIDGKLYYFDKYGYRMTDVSSKYTGSKPYYVEVDRVNGVMTVYTGSDKTIPIKTIRVSVGTSGTPTPTGTFRMTPYSRWQPLMGPSWGQYGTHVDGAGYGGIFVHSVAGSAPNSYSLPAGEYNRLGNPASHGCIRACVADAKWVYYNCKGATIRIFDGTYSSKETSKGPLGRKPIVPLRSPYNFDPTDPSI